MSDANLTGNDNRQVRNFTHAEVDAFAKQLCDEFHNHDFFRWYCSAIYELGLYRIIELRGRVKGAKSAPRLFSNLVTEEMRVKRASKLRYGIK